MIQQKILSNLQNTGPNTVAPPCSWGTVPGSPSPPPKSADAQVSYMKWQSICIFTVCVTSVVWLFATLWTTARQAPLSMGFFSGKNTGVGCHFLLQWIFLTEPWNLCLLHWQADSLLLSHLGSPQQKLTLWVLEARSPPSRCQQGCALISSMPFSLPSLSYPLSWVILGLWRCDSNLHLCCYTSSSLCLHTIFL